MLADSSHLLDGRNTNLLTEENEANFPKKHEATSQNKSVRKFKKAMFRLLLFKLGLFLFGAFSPVAYGFQPTSLAIHSSQVLLSMRTTLHPTILSSSISVDDPTQHARPALRHPGQSKLPSLRVHLTNRLQHLTNSITSLLGKILGLLTLPFLLFGPTAFRDSHYFLLKVLSRQK